MHNVYLRILIVTGNIVQLIPSINQSSLLQLFYFSTKNYWRYIESAKLYWELCQL